MYLYKRQIILNKNKSHVFKKWGMLRQNDIEYILSYIDMDTRLKNQLLPSYCKEISITQVKRQVKLDFVFSINYEDTRRLKIENNNIVDFDECLIPIELPIRRKQKIRILQRKISHINTLSKRSKKEIDNFKRIIFRNIRLQKEYQLNLARIIGNSASNIIFELDDESNISQDFLKELSAINSNFKILTEGLRG